MRLLVESCALSCGLLLLSLLLKFAWYPADADLDVPYQTLRCNPSDLDQKSEVAGSPRAKQSTIDRLSLSSSILQSCAGCELRDWLL